MQPSVPSTPLPPMTPPEQPAAPAAQANPVAALPLPSTPPPAPATNPVPQDGSSQTANLRADDADLIEMEWVQQVQKIVAQTRDNPFEQSKLFTALKAEYMQKRYGKSISSDN